MVETVSHTHTISGHCLCQAVTYTATVKSLSVDACHCAMCRRWAGGPMLCVECSNGQISIKGEENLAYYSSSAWADRGFCKVCGSSLVWRTKDGNYLAVTAGSLADETGFTFTKQIFVDEKPAYYDFSNDTEMLTGPQVMSLMTGKDTK